MKSPLALILALFTTAVAFAGEPAKKVIVPPEEDRWRFLLAMPGWMPALEGDTGVNGLVSHVDLDPGDLIRHYDMVASLRAEAGKGRFSISGDYLYTSLSDGIGTNTIVKKLDIQIDQTIAELALHWRVIDRSRGFVDVYAGVRYTNLFQQIVTQPNDPQIERAVETFGEEFTERVRAQIDGALSEGRLRSALTEAVRDRLLNEAASLTGPNPPQRTLPNGPLAGPSFGRVGRVIENLVQRRAAELIRAAGAEARAAAQAEVAALQAQTAVVRAAARRRAAELRASVNQRIAAARAEMQEEVEKKLHDGLDARAARTDDWWDPFIGLRARYNLNERFYLTAKGDVGGFGVGCDFTWQAEAALGCHLTQHLFAELGYRALSIDYDKDGLLYDVILHGAQVTMGIEF